MAPVPWVPEGEGGRGAPDSPKNVFSLSPRVVGRTVEGKQFRLSI